MKALALAAVNVRRMLRERSNVFFVFLFPMLLVLVLGVSFGGTFEPKSVIATDVGPR
jgi:ABC-2 type transport system permease protein